MTLFRQLLICSLLAHVALAQSDRGTITGTVSDPVGAVVPNVQIIARNAENGTVSETVTTATGNFTLASLPAGPYEVSFEASGFNKYVQQGIVVQVALTVHLDVTLKIGSTSETVSVTAEAPMLRTENAEASVNVTGDRINSFPLNFGGGAGAIGAIRSQMAFAILSPGVSGSGTGARINGFAGNTFRVMIDGQDTTSGNGRPALTRRRRRWKLSKNSRCKPPTSRQSTARRWAESSISRFARGLTTTTAASSNTSRTKR